MNRIRVLEVIDKTFLGGGQINLLSLVDSLSKTEFILSVCSAASGPLAEAVRSRGIDYYPVDMARKFRPETVSQIKSIIQSRSFDIIHTHGGVAGLYARIAAGKAPPCRLVHTQHGIHFLHYRNPLLKRLYIHLDRWLSRRTDAVIFVSQNDLQAAMRYKLCAPPQAKVIHNGIDAETIADAAAQAKEPAELKGRSRPVIGTVARLHYQKNIPTLLSAAAVLRRRFPGITVVIAGDGPERSSLEGICRRLGVEKNVFFLGERHDIPELLNVMQVFVLPSRWEGLPYALLEAGAAKKPVAAAAVDGIREVIESGRNGLLVPEGRPDDLAEAIQRLLDDEESAEMFGEKLYKDVVRKFSLSRMADQTRNLYINLCKSMPAGHK
jgi:glycosyltransferase involved in cell wall biosynthesis